jgi:hypothetical protein
MRQGRTDCEIGDAWAVLLDLRMHDTRRLGDRAPPESPREPVSIFGPRTALPLA